MARPSRNLTRSYAADLRLLPSWTAKIAAAGFFVLWLALPIFMDDDFWLSILNYAGIAAIGAIGLNLLTGYTGQVSLGHAFFLGVGAYTAAQLGGELELPFVVWLIGAGLVGALIGAVIGPFALRLRGNYLAIVTLGLVFVGEYAFRNLDSVTGGNSGTSVTTEIDLGLTTVSEPELFGQVYTFNQGWFWFIWAAVALVVLLVKNIVRTRPGRAIQAIRDKDVAAEIIGVRRGRFLVGAFALSSALAGIAGALFGSYQQFVSPDEWSLFLSIQYIAIIIVGGVATIFGSILGALFLGGLPSVIERYSGSIPFLETGGNDGIISVFAFNQLLFGLLIVLFLIFEPLGLAAIWLRVKAYFKSWPFSY
jgi:branched-chain amino acid transport system permease protein